MSDEISWKSATLNKGKFMAHQFSDRIFLTIEHPDRQIDPYLAAVVADNIIVYTGLHPTLGSARSKCTKVAQAHAKFIKIA